MPDPRRAPSSLARVFWRALAACLILACALPSTAAPASPLRFQHLSGLGLSDLSIMSLAQDRQGFAWIGTSAGLYRYDGYQALRHGHDPRNPRSLPHDRVADIYEDRQGRIWAGTQEGLARFDPHTNDFTRFVPPRGNHTRLIVKKIISDGAHGMWIATWGGLQHFDPRSGRFTIYEHDPHDPDSIASNDTNALVRDEVGGIWVATWPGGLDYLAPGSRKFRHYRIDFAERPDTKLNIARALHIDTDKNLWIGTEKGAMLLRAGAWEERVWLPTPDSRINNFYSDRSGTIWAGTVSAGLLRWERGSDTPVRYRPRLNDPYSLQSEDVRSLMQDRAGMLWIGTFTDGINLVNRNSGGFQRYLPHNDDPDRPGSALQSMAGAPNGRLWLGTTRGFSLFDPASGKVERTYRAQPGRPGSLSNDMVYSLYQQPGGPLWVGTAAGLNRLDRPDGTFTVTRFDHIVSGFINVIAPSANGSLWLGTGAQVIRFDPATGFWTSYPSEKGKPGSRSVTGTTVILEDRRGRVWMGSEWNGGGLDMLDPATGKFRNFAHVPGDPLTLSHANVTSLYEDARGSVWVGTTKGVHQMITAGDGSITMRTHPISGGAGNARALAMLDDEAGMLWISTATGLVRLDPDSGTMQRYTVTDGLSAGYRLGTAFKSPDGRLFFGGNKGFTAVDPRNVRTLSFPPQVAITRISVLNRSLEDQHHGTGATLTGTVTAPRTLTLTADDPVFSVEFAALHYTNPGENRYTYRLAGFNRDWVHTDARHRNATYTNLNPGEYRFEVKAANDRGLWSRDAASFKVTILPPFWATWWFRAVAGLTTFALLAAAYRMRVRSLTRQQERLRELVAERTRELQLTNAKLEELTTTDPLTGIGNRRAFDHALAREWRRARRTGSPVALAMFDVDHFKSYNDCYGHQAGDQALREVAALISAHARRTPDVVARYGGEEFALLAPAASLEQAIGMANGICAALQALALPHAGAPGGVITISVGVAALVPGADDAPALLIGRADQALYRAKLEGRNRAIGATEGTVPGERTVPSSLADHQTEDLATVPCGDGPPD